MANDLLSFAGGRMPHAPRHASHPLKMRDLDARVTFLQSRALEPSTLRHYLTGARDYITFCHRHGLPLSPTPQTLARSLAYTSQFVASGPKYLVGARHFLAPLFPAFESSRHSPAVQAVIRGARKVRADPIRRKLPLRIDHLEHFLRLADRTNSYDDLLFAAIPVLVK